MSTYAAGVKLERQRLERLLAELADALAMFPAGSHNAREVTREHLRAVMAAGDGVEAAVAAIRANPRAHLHGR